MMHKRTWLRPVNSEGPTSFISWEVKGRKNKDIKEIDAEITFKGCGNSQVNFLFSDYQWGMEDKHKAQFKKSIKANLKAAKILQREVNAFVEAYEKEVSKYV